MIRRAIRGMTPVALGGLTLSGGTAAGTTRLLELNHQIGGVPMDTLELLLWIIAGLVYLVFGCFMLNCARRRMADPYLPWWMTTMVLVAWPILMVIGAYLED